MAENGFLSEKNKLNISTKRLDQYREKSWLFDDKVLYLTFFVDNIVSYSDDKKSRWCIQTFFLLNSVFSF